jgi:competence protein ComEC
MQIVLACGAFLLGLWLGHVGWSTSIPFIVVAVGVVLLSHRSQFLALTLVLASLALGILRSNVVDQANTPIQQKIGQKVTVNGTITDDPTLSDKNYVEFSVTNPQLPRHLKARTHYMKLARGYSVKVTGKLSGNWRTGLAEFGFADVEIISREVGWLEDLRQRFIAGVRTSLPEPIASFALGLLLGTRALLPKALQEQLTAVGLAHLVAVSGYNLTIIMESMKGLLAKWSRRLGLYLALLVVLGFVLLTGFSASIVRAAVVAVLGLWAAYYGRSFKPMALIALAAVITTAWQPSYLWNDVGWQLSFAAFFGILVVAPMIERRYFSNPHWILSMAIQSLAAQIMTAPIIMFVFGRFSLVAPISNLLILPFVPLAMLLSMVAGLAGILVPALSGWIGWPAGMLLSLMLTVVAKLAGHSWTELPIGLTSEQTIALYSLILLLVVSLGRYNVVSKRASDVGTLQMGNHQTQESSQG